MEGPPTFGGAPGTPVPAVDPEDLKAVWQVYRNVEMSHPGQRVGICMDSLACECKTGADIQAITYRIMMLQLIQHVAPESLAAWTKDGELDEAVFRVVADIPMEWLGKEIRQGLPVDVDEFFRRVRGKGA